MDFQKAEMKIKKIIKENECISDLFEDLNAGK